jgi:hypothetical protein
MEHAGEVVVVEEQRAAGDVALDVLAAGRPADLPERLVAPSRTASTIGV